MKIGNKCFHSGGNKIGAKTARVFASSFSLAPSRQTISWIIRHAWRNFFINLRPYSYSKAPHDFLIKIENDESISVPLYKLVPFSHTHLLHVCAMCKHLLLFCPAIKCSSVSQNMYRSTIRQRPIFDHFREVLKLFTNYASSTAAAETSAQICVARLNCALWS